MTIQAMDNDDTDVKSSAATMCTGLIGYLLDHRICSRSKLQESKVVYLGFRLRYRRPVARLSGEMCRLIRILQKRVGEEKEPLQACPDTQHRLRWEELGTRLVSLLVSLASNVGKEAGQGR